MKTDGNDRLLSLEEAGRLLAASKRTVHRLIASGELPRPLRLGRLSRLTLEDVEAYIEKLKGQRGAGV